jgi:hypothetical protein
MKHRRRTKTNKQSETRRVKGQRTGRSSGSIMWLIIFFGGLLWFLR